MLNKEILDTDDIMPLLLKLSVPTIIGGFVSALYNIVDSIFIGHFVGSEALAALTISNTVQLAYIAFAALWGAGTGTIISRFLGAKQYKKVNTALYTGIFYVVLCTIILSLLLLIFVKPLLLYMGATEKILEDAIIYTRVLLWFGFVVPVNAVFASILRAKGWASQAMNLSILGAVLNIILDALFIISFGWGVFGAALATALAQLIVLLYSVFYVIKAYNLLDSINTFIRFDNAILTSILQIGLPSGLRLGMIVITSLSANKALQPYGVVALASFGIVNRLVSLAFMPMQGCNFGAQPIISYNYGAKRLDRLKMILYKGSLMMFIIGTIGTLGFVYAPLPFFTIFTKDNAIILLSKEALAYSGSLFFLFGVYMILSGFIQSVGYIKEALFLALFRPLFNACLFQILPIFFGLKGIWYVMPISDIINIVLALVLTINVFRKVEKKLTISNQSFEILRNNDA